MTINWQDNSESSKHPLIVRGKTWEILLKFCHKPSRGRSKQTRPKWNLLAHMQKKIYKKLSLNITLKTSSPLDKYGASCMMFWENFLQWQMGILYTYLVQRTVLDMSKQTCFTCLKGIPAKYVFQLKTFIS